MEVLIYIISWDIPIYSLDFGFRESSGTYKYFTIYIKDISKYIHMLQHKKNTENRIESESKART